MHLAAAEDLILADDRDVVLGLAGDDAGVAADAGVEVDRHAPLVDAVELRGRVKRAAAGNLPSALGGGHGRADFAEHGRAVRLHADALDVGEAGSALLRDFVEIGFPDEIAAFHRPVFLDVGEQRALAGVHQRRASGKAHRRRRAERVGAGAGPLPHMARRGAAVAECDDERVIRKAGLDVDRAADLAATDGDLEDAGVFLADLKVVFLDARHLQRRTLGVDAELLAELRADENGVVPGNLRDRVRALLQPAVVGEAAVVHLVVGDKADLEVLGGQDLKLRRGRKQRAGTGEVVADLHLRIGRIGQQAVVEELTEGFLGIGAGIQARDRRIDLRVAIGLFLAQDVAEDLDLGQAVEQRQNHRLHRDDCAVHRAGVAPRLEIMRARDLRGGQRGGLIGVITDTDDLGHGLLQAAPLEISRRVIGGIAAEDDEGLDRTTLDGGGEGGNRGGTAGADFDEIDRLADVAEGGIQRVDDRVDRGGLVRTGDDDALAGMITQIFRAGGEPLFLILEIETLG